MGNSGNESDYELVSTVGVGGVKLAILQGASESTDGEIGLVPKPLKGQEKYILTGDGNWSAVGPLLSSLNYVEPIELIGPVKAPSGTTIEIPNGRMFTEYYYLLVVFFHLDPFNYSNYYFSKQFLIPDYMFLRMMNYEISNALLYKDLNCDSSLYVDVINNSFQCEGYKLTFNSSAQSVKVEGIHVSTIYFSIAGIGNKN